MDQASMADITHYALVEGELDQDRLQAAIDRIVIAVPAGVRDEDCDEYLRLTREVLRLRCMERYVDIVLDQTEPVMVVITPQIAAGGHGD